MIRIGSRSNRSSNRCGCWRFRERAAHADAHAARRTSPGLDLHRSLRGASTHRGQRECMRPSRGQIVARSSGILAVLRFSTDLFRQLAPVESPWNSRVIDNPQSAHTVASGQLAVMLDGIQDPGNVGTIIRSAQRPGQTRCFCPLAVQMPGRREPCVHGWRTLRDGEFIPG